MSIRKLSVVFNVLLVCGIAYAKVPPEQMARLDQDLTPLGSERGANKDGSIPEWNGGLTTPPEGIGYEKGKHLPDPFAADKPLFRVTGANAGDYDQFITRGQKALLERHDSYFIDVYPTRRSCAHPELFIRLRATMLLSVSWCRTATALLKQLWLRLFQFLIMA